MPLHQSRTDIEIVTLKNGQGDIFVPFKIWGKTQLEAHKKRYSLVQKLQAKTQTVGGILSGVLSSFLS